MMSGGVWSGCIAESSRSEKKGKRGNEVVEQLADGIARRYGREPELIAAAIKVPIYEEELPPRIREMYIGESRSDGIQAIVVRRGLLSPERRELIAHGLAHHFMHCGNRVSQTSGVAWSGRHEHEADDFAACLLIPGLKLAWHLDVIDPPPTAELADEFDVREALLDRRLSLMERASTILS
jgi:Zn-dependent peptidase ImmA (M78 family)